MKTSVNTYSSVPGVINLPVNLIRLVLIVTLCLFIVSCASRSRRGIARKGDMGVKVASWYGPTFHGKLTASGERYNMYDMTAAHKTLPFGTILRLTNVKNGKRAKVLVNDRGPFIRGRDIDLSKSAAKQLGIIGPGTGRVRAVVIGRDMRYSKYIKGGKISHRLNKQRAKAFTIQVAAFSEKESATHMLRGLRLNYKKVYMVEKWIDGKRFYRVRVGKFRSESKALSYADRLSNEGYKARVTPYDM